MRTVGGAGVAIILSATAALAAIPIPVIYATEENTGFSGGSVPPTPQQQAQAQQQQPAAITVEGASPYIEIGAGFNFLEGATFTNAAGAAITGSQLNFDIGPAVTGALGYAFGNGWRAEFELGYRNSPASDLTLANGAVVGGSIDLKAHVNAFSYMGNVLYDFDLTRYGIDKWTPHLGGGIGAVNLQPNRAPAETVFGGQAIAGIEYVVTPILRFGLDYRYIGTTSAGFTFTQNGITVGRTANTAFNDHTVLFTMRWKFGVR
jgi:opacity protein-like surface antigen